MVNQILMDGGMIKTKLLKEQLDMFQMKLLNYLGLGYADDQIEIKYTVDTSTWSATLGKVTVI